MSTKYPSINKQVFQLPFQSNMIFHERSSAYNHHILTCIRSTLHAESACSAGDLGSIPGLGRSTGEGKNYLFQYSGLENSMDSPWGHKESETTEELSLFTSQSFFSRHTPSDPKTIFQDAAAKSLQSCPTLCDPVRPRGLQPTRLLRPWDFPGKSTGVGCNFLLQRLFLTQELNLGLLHWRHTLYCLRHREVQKSESGWLSPVWLFAIPCSIQSMEFSRPEYWNG